MKLNSARSILWREALGFGVVIGYVWIAEVTHLPSLLYGDPPAVNVWRAVFRTTVIALVWVWVHFTNRRLLRRLHELEGFLHVCSWCRKVGHEDQWLTMEEYFGSKLATETSHGICPDCAKRHLGTGSTPSVARVNPPDA